jgi:hypothetical protein
MLIVGLDTETERIRKGLGAPPLVSAAFCRGDDYELVHHTEAKPRVVATLEGDELIVGANTAFDAAVICAQWPDLIHLVFEVYEADRVTDVLLREKLLHIALGVMHKFERIDGEVVHLDYGLSDLVRRYLKAEMAKGVDTWRLRYGELRDTPVAWWPEEAVEYAVFDVVVLEPIYERQQVGAEYLEDEYRQARAAFWIQLMEVWGMPINIEGVRAFAKKTHLKYVEIMDELIVAGLARKKKDGSYSRCEKLARQRMENVCVAAGIEVERTDPSKTHPDGQAIINYDHCQRFGDDLLKQYGEASSLGKTLSTDLPLLLGVPRKKVAADASDEDKVEAKRVESARKTMLNDLLEDRPVNVSRIWTHFDSLKNSGRTGSAPNFQNWPTEQGMRECVEPSPGCVFAIADYSQFELRTWSQCCLWMFKKSRMAEFLNAGGDPHCEIARLILGISYEEAAADYARDRKGRVYYPRQTGKVANFGLPGGLRELSLVDYARTQYGVILTPWPDHEAHKRGVISAQELIEAWYDTWPESHLWFEELGKLTEDDHAQIKQYVSNRIRGDVGLTDGANTLFQGLAADGMKAAGFLIAKACYAEPESPLYGWRTCNSIHDEFVLEGPDDERAHDAAEELSRLMILGAAPFVPDVPPLAEALLARRWSKASKPLYDARGRLVPWDFGVEDAMKEAAE